MEITTYRLITEKELCCPCCQSIISGATDVWNSKHPRPPVDNDITVCKYCESFLIFRGHGKKIDVAKLTDKELKNLLQTEPDTYAKLHMARHGIRYLKKSR